MVFRCKVIIGYKDANSGTGFDVTQTQYDYAAAKTKHMNIEKIKLEVYRILEEQLIL